MQGHVKNARTAPRAVLTATTNRDADVASGGARQGIVVTGSLLGGLASATALVAVFLSNAREHAVTGGVLLGFAVGWTLLVVLSARFTARPQRWAAVPAVAMALTGVALIALAPSDATLSHLGWVWPPALLALVIWMTVHARRQLTSRARPLLLYPVFAVLAFAAVGGSYETVLASTDPDQPTNAPGHRLVDVGGYKLDIRCVGTGTPTVVLEPGLGESATAMARWIAPDVGRATRICVYDRAGHGRSQAAPGNRTTAATDLDALLRRAHIPGPYVIAGHSLGGLIALNYTRRYPDQVAGLVLLDSMHPHQTNTLAGMDPLMALLPTLARTGLGRFLFNPNDGRPVDQARQFARDVADMPVEMNDAAKLTTLGNRPLAVVTAASGNQSGWGAHQNELAALSGNTRHLTVTGSTHQSLIDDQAHAAQSSRAIRDIVLAVRQSARK